jgi:DNA-binding MarR family transcriptional regulator
MIAHEGSEVGRRLRDEALTVSTSIWTWTRSAGLGIAEGPVLLALSEIDGAGASAVSDRSGLPLDTVYPALHRLTDRGYVVEEHRRHSLTADGQRLVADFDRFAATGSTTQTEGMS